MDAVLKTWTLLVLSALLAACASTSAPPQQPERLFADDLFHAPAVKIDAADVFALTPDMAAYLEHDVARLVRTRGRQQGLYEALYTRGQLQLEYDAAKTRNAAEAFAARQGNCLSLVIMTAAFARELGMTVHFRSVMVDETWSRESGLYLVASHVNRQESTSPQPAASEEQRSFNKLWARIEASESASTPATGTTGTGVAASRSARTVRWLAAAVVVQAIGLGVLGVAFVGNDSRNGSELIHTVADPQPRLDAPAVSIAFAPETSMGTVNTLLTHQGLSIVGGPGGEGNFQAQLSADAVASGATAESVAAVLSKDPNVTFAQPIAH